MLRVQKKIARVGEEASAVDIAICRTYFYDIADKINKAAKDAIYSFAEGDEVRMMTMGLKRFTKTEVYNQEPINQFLNRSLNAIDVSRCAIDVSKTKKDGQPRNNFDIDIKKGLGLHKFSYLNEQNNHQK